VQSLPLDRQVILLNPLFKGGAYCSLLVFIPVLKLSATLKK